MENIKKGKSNIWEILKYLRVFRGRVAIGILLVVASKVFSVADPYVMKKLIDVLVDEGPGAPLE